MYEISSQSDQDQFWLNIGIMILIAGLFVAGLYYYQHQQLSQMKDEIDNLKVQVASLTTTPTTPTTTPNVSQQKAITSGTRELSRIALTFDADMTSSMKQDRQWYDPEIIKILKENQVPATFFLTGMWAETYPQVTKQLANNPLFEVENHCYQTKAFSQPCYGLTPLKNKKQKTAAVEKAQQVLKKLTGTTPTYFRFPGGCHQQQDLKLINELGLKVIQWDVVSGDSFAKQSSSIVDQTLNQTRNGSIVVFHLGGPNAPHTAQALKQIIPQLKQQGYRFSTVHSLLNPPSASPNGS